MKLNPKVEDAMSLLEPDFEILEKGKQRQQAIGRNENTDYLPLLLSNTTVPEKKKYCQPEKDYCQYNFKEQFYDRRKMLFEQLWELLSAVRGRSDTQLSVSARMGAGFLPTVFGLKQEIFEDKDPWLQERLSKEEIGKLNLDDLENINRKGLMTKALDYIDYFRDQLEGKAVVCIDYTWGPFSLAHLIRGDDIFTDLYDDSKFVHHLMEVSTQLYIKALSLLKEAVGEPKESGYSNNFYMSNSGVWSNEDTAVLLSPSQLKKFVFPYLRKAYKPFGGAIIHFCGRADYLLDSLLELPEIKGINLGEPNWQKLSYTQIMHKLLAKGKTYYGSWPKKEREDTKSYFKRILEPLEEKKGGLVLAYSLTKEEQKNPGRVMELWRSLQR